MLNHAYILGIKSKKNIILKCAFGFRHFKNFYTQMRILFFSFLLLLSDFGIVITLALCNKLVSFVQTSIKHSSPVAFFGRRNLWPPFQFL